MKAQDKKMVERVASLCDVIQLLLGRGWWVRIDAWGSIVTIRRGSGRLGA